MTPADHLRFCNLVVPRLEEGFRLALWLTGSATDAEDVVQEASLRAWRAINSVSDANGRAWFLTIVRNTCHSWLKRHKPRALVFSEDLEHEGRIAFESGGALGEPAAGPETALIAKQEERVLASAIEALPVPMREALVLREYHGLTYREIASVSGVPVGTVMSRLARARHQVLAAVRGAA